MAKADAVEVDFQGGERSATRYANSSITANLIEHDQEVQHHRVLRAEECQHGDPPVRRRVAQDGDRRSADPGKRKPDNPELMPLVKPPQNYVAGGRRVIVARPTSARPSGPRWSRRASTSARRRAWSAPATSRSCTGRRRRPTARGCSRTSATPRPASSSPAARRTAPAQAGRGRPASRTWNLIDPVSITETAADKALKSQKPRAIEPGDYTVILEPRPAARFLSLLLTPWMRGRPRKAAAS